MTVRERFIDQINKNEHLVQVKWRAGAERIFNESYDSVVHLNDDEDDNCFYCPNCMEPIYEEDYSELDFCDKTGEIFCPICEISF